MAEDYILVCEDICRVYMRGDLESRVLKNINFRMKEGEFTAIMGPSGSGKSTLMNIIGCLDRPTSGKLFLDGQDVSRCTGKCRTTSDIRRRFQGGAQREGCRSVGKRGSWGSYTV